MTQLGGSDPRIYTQGFHLHFPLSTPHLVLYAQIDMDVHKIPYMHFSSHPSSFNHVFPLPAVIFIFPTKLSHLSRLDSSISQVGQYLLSPV